MSVNLTLLPFDHDGGESWSFSHTVLQAGDNRDLHDQIQKLNQLPVSADFTSYVSHDDAYEESHYGKTTKDPYGDQVRYTTAGELLTIDSKFIDWHRPKAVWAYLRELPANAKVALFWT